MFWIFWIIIIGIIIAGFYFAANWVGDLLGEIFSNNNYRLGLSYVLAIVLTISAILRGFGEPILWREGKAFLKPISEKTEKVLDEDSGKWRKEINYLLWGDRNIQPKKVEPPKPETPWWKFWADDDSDEPSYPSWNHWIFALLMWVISWIYTPIALREEVYNGLKALVTKKRRQTKSGTAGTTTSTPGGLSLFQRVKEMVTVDFGLEALYAIFKKITGR